MTYQDAYKSAKSWQRKCKVIYLYHSLLMNKKTEWSVRLTAQAFSVSLGTAGENILLGKHIREVATLGSRNKALKYLRAAKLNRAS